MIINIRHFRRIENKKSFCGKAKAGFGGAKFAPLGDVTCLLCLRSIDVSLREAREFLSYRRQPELPLTAKTNDE